MNYYLDHVIVPPNINNDTPQQYVDGLGNYTDNIYQAFMSRENAQFLMRNLNFKNKQDYHIESHASENYLIRIVTLKSKGYVSKYTDTNDVTNFVLTSDVNHATQFTISELVAIEHNLAELIDIHHQGPIHYSFISDMRPNS